MNFKLKGEDTIIEAMQWNGEESQLNIFDFISERVGISGQTVTILMSSGKSVSASLNDWIVKYPGNIFRCYDPKEFEKIYEKIKT